MMIFSVISNKILSMNMKAYLSYLKILMKRNKRFSFQLIKANSEKDKDLTLAQVTRVKKEATALIEDGDYRTKIYSRCFKKNLI
jgi:hypothetical protein